MLKQVKLLLKKEEIELKESLLTRLKSSGETFDKILDRYQKEKNTLLKELEECKETISNLAVAISKAVKLCRNLPQIWAKGDVFEKEKLQKLIFPEGILYDKEKGAFRTLEVNEAIAEIARRSGDLALYKIGTNPFLPGQSLSAERGDYSRDPVGRGLKQKTADASHLPF